MSSRKRTLPLQCPYCHGEYMGLTGVNQHIRRIHRANIPTDFQCEVCGEYSYTRLGLVRHKKTTHLGESGSKRRKVSDVPTKAEGSAPKFSAAYKAEAVGSGGTQCVKPWKSVSKEAAECQGGAQRPTDRETAAHQSGGERFEQCVCCEVMVPVEVLLKHTLQHTAELMSSMGSWAQRA